MPLPPYLHGDAAPDLEAPLARGAAAAGAQRLIGVDVGGTKTAVAALERDGLADRHVRPTDTLSAEKLIDEIVAAIAPLLPAEAVGVAVPSVVDWEAGAVRYSVNVPLAEVPLRGLLRERLGVPVYLDNDATCAALAEAFDERNVLATRHLVMFTVGTGVGGGIVIDGRVYRGTSGAAAELGHTIVAADLSAGAPPATAFPRPDSLETAAAGRALDRLAAASGLTDARGAVAAAREGRPEGREALRALGSRLGVGIANAINSFDPEVVAIGGGVAAAGELLLEPAVETARQYVLPGVGTKTEIRLARYGNDAGVRGAALMAGQELALERSAGGAPTGP